MLINKVSQAKIQILIILVPCKEIHMSSEEKLAFSQTCMTLLNGLVKAKFLKRLANKIEISSFQNTLIQN